MGGTATRVEVQKHARIALLGMRNTAKKFHVIPVKTLGRFQLPKLRIPATEPIVALFQVFLGAPATAMEGSTVLVTTGTGGAVRRAVQTTLTAASCTTTMTCSTETTTIGKKGYLSVASGIENGLNLTLSLSKGNISIFFSVTF